ncbi:hypothetical protein ACJX0J_028626, partial [Zea mays]
AEVVLLSTLDEGQGALGGGYHFQKMKESPFSGGDFGSTIPTDMSPKCYKKYHGGVKAYDKVKCFKAKENGQIMGLSEISWGSYASL